jgi:small GTP-binding protein
VVIGDASVGKTSILNRLVDQGFDAQEKSTIGANYQLWVERIADRKIELQIWDTAGQEKFHSLGPIYFRNAIGAIIVYDVTNRVSFDHLEDWVTMFTEVAEPGALITVVANKIDEEDHAVVAAEGRQWAESQNMDWAQVSAKTGQGVKELFRKFAKDLMDYWTAKKRTAEKSLAPPEEGCGC